MLRSLVTNRDILFTSYYWTNFCGSLRIKKQISIVFYLQTNSQTECQSQTLEAYLRIFINYQQDNWVIQLQIVEFVYNHALHTSIKITPFKATYGYVLALPQLTNITNNSLVVAVEECLKVLQDLQNQLESYLVAAQEI